LEEKRILVVDDDESLLGSLLAILQSEGYLVDTASTGQEAISKARTTSYDLMIVDVELPDMEGTDLLQRLPVRSPETIKIILTGHPNMDKVVTALFRGIDAYVLKPVSPQELLKIVSDKLAIRDNFEPMNAKNAADWIETRAQKI
jgi:DNA-binding response OmpR family regulator